MLRSIVLTLFVSALFAFGLEGLLGFWQSFALVTGLQFIAFWFLNSFQVTNKEALYAEFEEQVENILALSKVSQTCPCNDYTFEVEIFANTENVFRCPKCNNNVELGMMKTPILKTDPEEVTGQ